MTAEIWQLDLLTCGVAAPGICESRKVDLDPVQVVEVDVVERRLMILLGGEVVGQR